MVSSEHIYLVILAGGSGTRLWPLSRKDFPKQFLKVGKSVSFVRETAERLSSLVSWNHVFIVCGDAHQTQMKIEFPELNENQFLLEPCAKNTAAAIALSAQVLRKKDPNAIMVVLPADHKVGEKDHDLFSKLIAVGCDFAEQENGLITLGITPSYAATGYGYILKGNKMSGQSCEIFKVDRFQEKPDLKTAHAYYESKKYFWNSGMFIWKANTYLEAYERFLPKDAKALGEFEGGMNPASKRVLEEIYLQLTSISVDYAILEKSDSVYVLQADFEWDDVGSLSVLSKYYPKDLKNNAIEGNTVLIDSKDNLILSDEGIVACLGVENLIIIKNKESILVLPKQRSEEVKKILEELKKQGNEKYL